MFSRRVLLVEDDRLLGTALAQTLAAHNMDTRCVHSAKDAKRELVSFDPDVAVVDIDLGAGPSGIDFVQVVARQRPEIVAILLSKHPDSISAGYTVDDIPRGVFFLRKSLVHDPQALVEAIDSAVKGKAGDSLPNEASGTPLDALTRTQREVLRLMALGHSNLEISKRRGVSVSTVEQRITEINRIFGIVPDGTSVPRVLAIRQYIDAVGLPK